MQSRVDWIDITPTQMGIAPQTMFAPLTRPDYSVRLIMMKSKPTLPSRCGLCLGPILIGIRARFGFR